MQQNRHFSQMRLDSHRRKIVSYSKCKTRSLKALGQAVGFSVQKTPTGRSQNCPFSRVSGYTQLNTARTSGQTTASSFFTLNSFERESSCSTCTSAYSWSGMFCSWLSCVVLMDKQEFLCSNLCERTRVKI